MSETLKEAFQHNDPLVEVGHGHEQESHAGRVYIKVLGTLLVLTVITVLASRVQFGSGFANVVVAMGIASVKATLVALFFMHLRYDRPMNAIIFAVSLGFFTLFLVTCYMDQQTRFPSEPINLKAPIPAAGAPPGAQAPSPGAGVAPAPPTQREAVQGASH